MYFRCIFRHLVLKTLRQKFSPENKSLICYVRLSVDTVVTTKFNGRSMRVVFLGVLKSHRIVQYFQNQSRINQDSYFLVRRTSILVREL